MSQVKAPLPPRAAHLDGVLLVDKDPGPTSHDVVAACRKILGEKRIGHCGTLDPIAAGLLPLAVGRATRLTRFFLMERKRYHGTIRLGYSTDTFDRAGKPTSEQALQIPSPEEIREAAQAFRGRIRHIVPAFSARKVGGKKLYELARQGEVVPEDAKEVEIFSFEIERIEGAVIEFEVECSTGTYVRSLAHELGTVLGCGAHLDALRRLRVGEFSVENAVTVARLRELRSEGRATEALVPMQRLLAQFEPVPLALQDIWEITHGKDILRRLDLPPVARYVKLVDTSGALVAVGEVTDRHSSILTIHPSVVLAP